MNNCKLFTAHCKLRYTKGMRYLGIDYGSQKVGLALSDEAGTMGFPHAVVQNTPKLVDELRTLIAEKDVGAVVVGESQSLSGEANPIAEAAHRFGDELTERSGVPVVYESEVYTTAEARRSPEKEEKTRVPKSKRPVDDSAAALILTSYLTKLQATES